jgi:Lon protease-like protein
MTPLRDPLPLFPLRSVLFPGGQLALKIFEARYLDLISTCLREERAFGVVCLRQGGEVRTPAGQPAPADEGVKFETTGTLAHLMEVDAERAGLLMLRCQGGARFSFEHCAQRPDGLWVAQDACLLDDDAKLPPGEAYREATDALARAIAALDVREPGLMPAERHLDQAGWVANRWCELLPIPMAARQQLMALGDPLLRLKLVNDYLRQKQLI